jgi:hypothetical protein
MEYYMRGHARAHMKLWIHKYWSKDVQLERITKGADKKRKY